MDGFAYWIFGYPKFAEPIIRECICIKKGWQNVMGDVKTPPISDLLQSIDSRTDWDDDFGLLKQSARNCLMKRKRRMALDAAFLDNHGAAIIGEFKSWGGWYKFSKEELYEQIIKGKLFPDRLAINKVYYNEQPIEVSRFVIAMNLAVQNIGDILWEIGGLTVEVLEIADMLHKYGERVIQERGSIAQLDLSVNAVKQYIRTGGIGSAVVESVETVSEDKTAKEGVGKMEAGQNREIEIFIDDDNNFLQWLLNNPSGFVVNCHKKPSPDYLILHTAKCKTIRRLAKKRDNWIANWTNPYIKVCALEKTKLDDWAEKEIGGELQPCQRCNKAQVE
jgi:hypothetical protein